MNLLIEVVIVGVAIAMLSLATVIILNTSTRLKWYVNAVLALGPTLDAELAVLGGSWLGLQPVSAVLLGLVIGVFSLTFLQPLLVPRRLLVWRLALNNIVRRRRQSALMIGGMIVASAIITSSLVIGDSLDATIVHEVESSWGESDVIISGINPQTGVSSTFSHDVAVRTWDAIKASSLPIEGRQYGLVNSVSLTQHDGRGEPSLGWFAFNSSVDDDGVWPMIGDSNGVRYSKLKALNENSEVPLVVINEVAADSVGLAAGDLARMGVFITDENGQRVQRHYDVLIHDVVAQEGQALMAGVHAGAVFSDLETAWRLIEEHGTLNQIALSFQPDVSDADIRSSLGQLASLTNASLLTEDTGVEIRWNEDAKTYTITQTEGFGRLEAEDIIGLRENVSQFIPGSIMMEVLQAPLAEVVVAQQSLLTLADQDITSLYANDEVVWHIGQQGLGFERFSSQEAWLWTSDDERIEDVAFSPNNETVVFLFGTEASLKQIDSIEESVDLHYDFSNDVLAVVYGEGTWFVLHSHGDSIALSSTSDFNQWVFTPLNISLPSSVLSYELEYDEGMYVYVEGLFSTDAYAIDLSTGMVNQIDRQISDQGVSTSRGEACNGVDSIVADGANWCTTSYGLAVYDVGWNELTSIRLPILSEAGGFGTLPQMVLAFGGDGASINVQEGTFLSSNVLNPLALEIGQAIELTGLFPYAFGNDSAYALSYGGVYSSLEGFEALSEIEPLILGLVHLSDAEQLALAQPDERSFLLISSPTSNATHQALLTSWFDEQSTIDDLHLQVSAVKLDAKDQAAESSGLLAAMFLVFGSFTIAAGVLLMLTIIMLLLDVRKKELAAVRALGLRQSDARALLFQEGFALSCIGGLVGSVIGIGVAWFVANGFASIFDAVGAIGFRFDASLDSFLSGWLWGTLISSAILFFTGWWNARLNIVQALRGGRKATNHQLPWTLFLMQIIAFGAAAISGLTLMLVGFSSAVSYPAYLLLGASLMLVFIPLCVWQVPSWLKHNERAQRWARNGPRHTIGVLGAGFLLWTMVLEGIDPIRSHMEPSEFAFIVLGLLQVISGVGVLSSLAPMILVRLSRSPFMTARFGAVGPVAFAHPLAHPIRTAVVMGMFSITMFSVVVLAGYTAQFDTYSSGFVKDAEGEYELLVTSSRSRPIELSSNPSEWGLNSTIVDSIDSVGKVARAPIFLEGENDERMPYILRGFDTSFALHGGLPLYTWDTNLGETQEEAWISIENFNDIVFVDASFGLENAADGATIVPLQFSIGDSIFLIDYSNPANKKEVKVGGFLQQSSYVFSPGVWMNDDLVLDQFGGEVTRMYVSVSDDARPTDDFAPSESPSPQGKSENVRLASLELEELLSGRFAEDGVHVQTIASEVMLIQSLVLAILSLFEGYLALGLLVGVAGLSIVTIRQVSERRQTIGMLRAIGFRRAQVMGAFSVETAWVCLLGMLNGWLVGYGFHRSVHLQVWDGQGVDFVFPWVRVLSIFVVAIIIVVVSLYPTLRKAAHIQPSDALRQR